MCCNVTAGWTVGASSASSDAICAAVERAQAKGGMPSVIVLNTVKGKGWPDAEQRVPSHYMTVSAQQLGEYEMISAPRMDV